MDFLTIFNQILIIFILIIIGYLAAKLGYLTVEVRRGISEILVNIAIPAVVIVSFDIELSPTVLREAGIVLVFSLLSHLLSALISIPLFRRYPDQVRKVLAFTTVFTNSAFIGYPVIGSLFGSTGIFFAAIYNMAYNLFVWTYGQVLFNGAKNIRGTLKEFVNAGTIAVAIGIVLLLTPLKLPALATEVATLVGSLTTPLAMMIIGSMVAGVQLREMFQGKLIYGMSVLRLLILPAIAYLILAAFGIESSLRSVCVLMVALPAGTMAAVFSEKYHCDTLLATRIIVLTTALSIVTIPVVAMLAG